MDMASLLGSFQWILPQLTTTPTPQLHGSWDLNSGPILSGKHINHWAAISRVPQQNLKTNEQAQQQKRPLWKVQQVFSQVIPHRKARFSL